MRHIYIAGPMRGHDGFNFPAFFEAEEAVRVGYPGAVIKNPARMDTERFGLGTLSPLAAGRLLEQQSNFGPAELRTALAADLAFITEECDLMIVLPGWEQSKGATAEVAAARALGIEVIEYGAYFTLPPPVGAHPDSPAMTEWESAAGMLGDLYRVDEAGIYRKEAPRAVSVASGAEIRLTSATGGEKGSKAAAFDQISPEVETLIAKHFGAGARKYAAHNFRNGYAWSLSYSALRRHLADFWGGKEYDTCPKDGEGCLFEHPKTGEQYDGPIFTCWNHTGSLHIVAVIWHAMVLTEFFLHHKNYDDRFVYDESGVFGESPED